MIEEEDSKLIYSIMLDMGFNAYKILSVCIGNILSILDACPDKEIGIQCRESVYEIISNYGKDPRLGLQQLTDFGKKLTKWQTPQ